MRVLVLGGTGFVGRAVVDAALDAGLDVTLFNRGRSNPTLFPEVEHRTGDRNRGDLSSLSSGEWDAVIDVNAYLPQRVRDAAVLLNGRVGTYCFVSTNAVYVDPGPETTDEDAAVLDWNEPYPERMDHASYGPLKAKCEQELVSAFDGATVITRPCVVSGPHDPIGMTTYWVRRAARGGTILAGGRRDQPIQLVHAADHAAFIVSLLQSKTAGVFNTVGPDDPATLGDLIDACVMAADVRPDAVVWATDQQLRDHNVTLPFVMPSNGRWDGNQRRSNDRAKAAGFRNRALVETAAEVLAWDRANHQTGSVAGPTPEREAEALAAISPG